MRIQNPQIIRTTERAALVAMTAAYSTGRTATVEVWLPKSHTSYDVAADVLEIADWLIEEKQREVLRGAGHFANYAAPAFAVGDRVSYRVGMGKNADTIECEIVRTLDGDSRDDQGFFVVRHADGRETDIGAAQLTKMED